LPAPSVVDERAIDDLATLLPLERSERLELIEADGPLGRAAILLRVLRAGSRAG
jgi:hypothetical protein